MEMTAVALFSTTMILSTGVQAVPMYASRIPNGDNVPGVKALGHQDSTGESTVRNVFGIAFEEAETTWTKQLCAADSDEDGQTNGQELGDPCCIWYEGEKPQWTDGVSNPGDDTKKSDQSRWDNLDCHVLEAEAKAKAEAEGDAGSSINSPNEEEDSEIDISTGHGDSSSVPLYECIGIPAIMFTIALCFMW